MENLFETRPDFTCNHDMRRCTVNGKEMFCTDERIKDSDMPSGLYKAEVRASHHDGKWSTIESTVGVFHCATLVSDEPFKFDEHKSHPTVRKSQGYKCVGRGMHVIECPNCHNIIASADEAEHLPKWILCKHCENSEYYIKVENYSIEYDPDLDQ